MKITDTSDLWWKTAVVYCLDVETFLDSNGDGVGDLQGLAQRIDYLSQLGVTCLWLMPFYPSPDRDDGYDVSDFYGVDSRLGTHGDFVEVIRTARDRGMRVIVDLVINHTSDRHPWFLAAKRSVDSPYRDYYVWRDDAPPKGQKNEVFPGQANGWPSGWASGSSPANWPESSPPWCSRCRVHATPATDATIRGTREPTRCVAGQVTRPSPGRDTRSQR